MEDIINGRLDNSGPLLKGRRLGVALITPEYKAGFIEGHQLRDLSRTGQDWVPHYVVIMKEAALDFVFPDPAPHQENVPSNIWRFGTLYGGSVITISTHSLFNRRW
jgi:hypothetical protein